MRKPQIPLLVKIRILRELPEAIDRRGNVDLNVDAFRVPPSICTSLCEHGMRVPARSMLSRLSKITNGGRKSNRMQAPSRNAATNAMLFCANANPFSESGGMRSESRSGAEYRCAAAWGPCALVALWSLVRSPSSDCKGVNNSRSAPIESITPHAACIAVSRRRYGSRSADCSKTGFNRWPFPDTPDESAAATAGMRIFTQSPSGSPRDCRPAFRANAAGVGGEVVAAGGAGIFCPSRPPRTIDAVIIRARSRTIASAASRVA